jgi:hypothetical protein
MSLQLKLDELKKELQEKIPRHALVTMHEVNIQLAESGILDKVLKIGDTIPEFILPDQNGLEIRSSQLLAHGPLILSFYRGVW